MTVRWLKRPDCWRSCRCERIAWAGSPFVKHNPLPIKPSHHVSLLRVVVSVDCLASACNLRKSRLGRFWFSYACIVTSCGIEELPLRCVCVYTYIYIYIYMFVNGLSQPPSSNLRGLSGRMRFRAKLQVCRCRSPKR